jgi:predicted metallo-beta-lactamase superfamily hydrolase
MKISPLAADSLGARSMATLVETRDVTVLIDPSVRLGPYRYDSGSGSEPPRRRRTS